MSIASENLSNTLIQSVKKAEQDVREIAREYGVKVRRNPVSGIDVTYSDGEKKRYPGWFQLRDSLVKSFDLAD